KTFEEYDFTFATGPPLVMAALPLIFLLTSTSQLIGCNPFLTNSSFPLYRPSNGGILLYSVTDWPKSWSIRMPNCD
ncbi:TPA: hypothetical protein ACWZTH_004772, partial [Escherichia coli]